MGGANRARSSDVPLLAELGGFRCRDATNMALLTEMAEDCVKLERGSARASRAVFGALAEHVLASATPNLTVRPITTAGH